MKAVTRLILVFSISLATSLASFAASNEVLLVFTANTELNRHLYSLLGSALASSSGGGYKVTATLSPGQAKPGAYKAIIVFSTRATSGLEPSLQAFMKGYSAPNELYLVTLLSRSSNLTVTPFTKSTGPAGVDGVAAATLWTGESRVMHNQWVSVLIQYLKTK